MTALVTRLRNIAAAKSRPMDRASCIETEAADEIERLQELATASIRYAHHWDDCKPAMSGACVCGLQSVLNQHSGFRPSPSSPSFSNPSVSTPLEK